MTNLEMLQFGRTLTDRPYGAQVAQKIIHTESFPLLLDFKGVISLGSSFGDELLSAIKQKGQRQIPVLHANEAVKSCLRKVAEDLDVEISF